MLLPHPVDRLELVDHALPAEPGDDQCPGLDGSGRAASASAKVAQMAAAKAAGSAALSRSGGRGPISAASPVAVLTTGVPQAMASSSVSGPDS